MKLDLYINEANDYARDIRVPVYHPHVAIIHYDEAGKIRHTLNRINCYGIFLQREFPENLTYGIGTYHEGEITSTILVVLSAICLYGLRFFRRIFAAQTKINNNENNN